MAVHKWRYRAAWVAIASLLIAAPAAAKFASIVVEADSGRVLYKHDADEQRHPASLAKMMTIYLLFEALDAGRLQLSTPMPVSAHAAAQSPTKLGLEEGDLITVREAILGLITKSANDAAAVAAEALAGSEERFARAMTQRARRLGMNRTRFENASGLPNPEQVSTAHDLAILARALIRHFPHHYHFFSASEFAFGGQLHPNHNRLIGWYQGADGLKTGFIRASGYNLVASARRGERRLIGVVLGGLSAAARDQEMVRLLDAGFARAPALPPVRQADARSGRAAGQAAAAEPVQGGAAPRPAARAHAADSVPQAAPEPRALAADRDWAIQVGVFARAEAARRAAETAAKLAAGQLTEAAIEVGTIERRKSPLYRARLLGLTQAEARTACRALERHKHDCLMLSPADLKGSVRVAAN
ncbi:MAG: D-alanyl-D-alanine carboxypeptidase family protein [Pseudomonadota bacterium]